MNQKQLILEKVGDISQIAGIRHIRFEEGRGFGTRAYEVYNAAGLRFTVLKDLCLDIFDCSYKGINLAFISKNGLNSSERFRLSENEFLSYWRGGFLYTCGLENVGPSCVEGGLPRAMHGRVGMLPAENVCAKAFWSGEDYVLCIEGEIHQTVLFGMSLRIKRKIYTSLYAKHITIEDEVENLTSDPEYFMLLYHFNFGYPLLDGGARVLKKKGTVKPRDLESEAEMRRWAEVDNPNGNHAGHVFFHENPNDGSKVDCVGLVNDSIALGVKIQYSSDTLPILTQWKCMKPFDYVLGLEPGNSYIMGREKELKNSSIKSIDGNEKVEFRLKIDILDGQEAIEIFEADFV